MGARRLAVAFDEPPPEVADDVYVDDTSDREREREIDHEPASLDRVCIGCGADARTHDGCDHREIARVDAPSRAVHEALARVRRAAAEHRAAARALRVLVLAEVARDRGDLETKPDPKPEPCPRCLIRDAEAAEAQKPPRRRAKAAVQQALPFKAS